MCNDKFCYKDYPTMWNLSNIYQNDKLWYEGLTLLEKKIENYKNLFQEIISPDDVIRFITFDEEVVKLMQRVYCYAYLPILINAGSNASEHLNKVENLLVLQNVYSNEVWSKVLKLCSNAQIMNNKKLLLFRHAVLSEDNRVRVPDSIQEYINYLTPALNQIEDTYGILISNVNDYTNNKNGYKYNVNEYIDIINSNNSKKSKVSYENKYLCRYEQYEATFAHLLLVHGLTAYGIACIEGFKKTIEYQLWLNGISLVTYNLMKKYSREGYCICQRYYEIKMKYMNEKKLFLYQAKISLHSDEIRKVSYDQIVNSVRKSLASLGIEYVSIYDEIVTKQLIDTYPQKDKVYGSMTIPLYDNNLVYVLLNLDGVSGDELTFAHEMGHAIYTILAQENQPTLYNDISTFLHEITAILNELLVNQYNRRNALSLKQKLYYTEQGIEQLINTYYCSSIYANFEEEFYSLIESNHSISAEELNKLMLHNYYDLYGSSIENVIYLKNQWIEIEHFRKTFYIYQYATAYAFALQIMLKLSESSSYYKQYITFLEAGESMSINELLLLLDIDINSQINFDYVNKYFSTLLESYIKLLDDNSSTKSQEGKKDEKE